MTYLLSRGRNAQTHFQRFKAYSVRGFSYPSRANVVCHNVFVCNRSKQEKRHPGVMGDFHHIFLWRSSSDSSLPSLGNVPLDLENLQVATCVYTIVYSMKTYDCPRFRSSFTFQGSVIENQFPNGKF